MIVGSVLAVLGLFYVLVPLMRGGAAERSVAIGPDLPPEASALDALREIEFDLATGKLSVEDYAQLRATYTPRAVAEMKAREAVAGGISTPRETADDERGAGRAVASDVADSAVPSGGV